MKRFEWPIRIYIEDTDAAGIVYYVNYLKFMERARTEFLRAIGFGHYLHTEDYVFVVRKADIRYRQPAKMDDNLVVSAEIVKQGKASLTFKQQLCRDNLLLAEAVIEIACVDRHQLKPCALPVRLLQLLTDYE
ncbi:tol-pal system-associated acyl-CoA thioesterase [Agitococcus lubricus]|uniref:4-hydroxybenzoyl-CoA thioesterase/acyl-CoA thioester hydrolase n=1 Tax=Agitococcus lubricus TaxID=1077255 RepID=A0A2T5IWJ1_9GAMM|nr:tol-pal system-associated acyl-CoA thioesterase [Agitococcus lubricus]PTQ88271.1 4-hydroxybenzoyl-CoA thioesterase/acyl-CoA thioester hydrolase [Agitococcus lubricus]